MNFLIVDDNPIYLELVAGWMIGSSYTYNLADSGKQAIELSEKHEYDLVITDLFMPNMSGAKLHNIFKSKNIPCIIISAETEYEITLDNIKHKYVKPYDRDTFWKIIKNVLKREYK
jgi:DNA-binding NtrC family response regulator